jgi:hypothetical protein
MHYTATVFGALLIIAPELFLHHYRFVVRFEPRQIWNRVRFRIHFSWITLYLAHLVARYNTVSVLLPPSDGNNESDLDTFALPLDVLLVACFPETIRSPAGYLGLCAAVSCVSSGLWLMTSLVVYVAGPSKVPRDPTNDGIDEFVWMLIVGLTNYYRDSEAIPQVNVRIIP